MVAKADRRQHLRHAMEFVRFALQIHDKDGIERNGRVAEVEVFGPHHGEGWRAVRNVEGYGRVPSKRVLGFLGRGHDSRRHRHIGEVVALR